MYVICFVFSILLYSIYYRVKFFHNTDKGVMSYSKYSQDGVERSYFLKETYYVIVFRRGLCSKFSNLCESLKCNSVKTVFTNLPNQC